MESKIKRKNKSWLIIIGSFLILGGAGLIGYDYYSNKLMDNEENKAIEEFYQVEEVEEIIEKPKQERIIREIANWISSK